MGLKKAVNKVKRGVKRGLKTLKEGTTAAGKFATLDFDGALKDANQAAKHASGVDVQEEIGKALAGPEVEGVADVKPVVDPRDLEDKSDTAAFFKGRRKKKGSILTGASGLVDKASTAAKTLLGA